MKELWSKYVIIMVFWRYFPYSSMMVPFLLLILEMLFRINTNDFDSPISVIVLLWLWCLAPLSTIFQLYRGSQFYCRGNWSILRKPPICRKSLTNFVVHLAWVWFELTTLVVIDTDCTCSYKSNYHTTTTSPFVIVWYFSSWFYEQFYYTCIPNHIE